jgi:hypothetical protein
VGTGTERHVLAAKCGQLGNAQTGLKGNEEKRAIAPSNPGVKVWGVEESVDLILSEEFNDPTLKPLARDGEDPLAEERVGRTREGDIAEEGVERREAGVAAASGISALSLEVIEELAEECGVEIGEHEAGGSPAELFNGKAQEQSEGVAVGGHSVRARPPLREQAVGKESLQERGKVGGTHCA